MNRNILPESPEDFLGERHDRYVELLENPRNWRKVPLLNYIPLHQLKQNNLLLRFRGMIQDIQEPEIFLKNYCAIQETEFGLVPYICNGHYQEIYLSSDNMIIDLSSPHTVTGRRRTLVVCVIPAINIWVTNFERKFSNYAIEKSPKVRSVLEESELSEIINSTSEKQYKRLLKRNVSQVSAEYSPIPKHSNQICWIKIYDNLDNYTVNTIVDVVGFYNMGPGHSALLTGLTESEGRSRLDVIPRLHAIAIHKLSQSNPYLDIRFIPQDSYRQTLNTRKELLDMLKIYVFDDELVAEFLLLHLLSTTYNHNQTGNIDKLSINFNIEQMQSEYNYGSVLHRMIKLLTVSSLFLPLNVQTLDKLSFMPL